jgi:DNA-binding transcriptional LysR family regulator
MTDRLEAMSLLVAAADAGSLSAAARRLHMPLPTFSRKVAELEARIGSRLLIRSTRRLAPTDAGLAYLDACRRILEEVAEAERIAAGEFSAPKGRLVLAAPVSFGRMHVLPVVIEFLRAFPDIDVHLALSDRLVSLPEDSVDLAVRIGALPDSALIATRIGEVRRISCASPGYLAHRGVPRDPADLAAHDCISFDSLTPGASWTFPKGRSSLAVDVRSRLVVGSAEAAVEAAAAGLGITRVLSYQAAAALRARQLREVLADRAPAPIPVSLLHASGRKPPAKLRAFLDFAAPRLRTQLMAGGAAPPPVGPRRGLPSPSTRRAGSRGRRSRPRRR